MNQKIDLKMGDCLEVLKTLPDNSVDSVVTDPPAGIGFMSSGKKDHWDSDKGGRDHWIGWMSEVMSECKRVMKPGAHGLVWALPRTAHWTGTALENAGFEIRDKIYHCFGTGFPKSTNVAKQLQKKGLLEEAKIFEGMGTSLKPSIEEWVLIRKPIREKTVSENVLKWSTGALNIDKSRIIPLRDGKRPDINHACEKNQEQSSVNIVARKVLPEEVEGLTSFVTESATDLVEKDESTTHLNLSTKPDTSDFDTGTIQNENIATSLSIDGFGSALTEKFPIDTLSTTETRTSKITESTTSSLCQEVSTLECTKDAKTFTQKNQSLLTTLEDGNKNNQTTTLNALQKQENSDETLGRWPSHFILSHNPDCKEECSEGCAVSELDSQSGISPQKTARTGVRGGSNPAHMSETKVITSTKNQRDIGQLIPVAVAVDFSIAQKPLSQIVTTA
jgi:hypothetical protein